MGILDHTELIQERVAELIEQGYPNRLAIEIAYDEIIEGVKK